MDLMSRQNSMLTFLQIFASKSQVNHYLARIGFVQLQNLLQRFLKTGDQKTWSAVLSKWADWAKAETNQDYFDQIPFTATNITEQSEGNKFELFGIDRIQDRSLLQE